jgi:NDP-sugar pyrophosphorylase family protein
MVYEAILLCGGEGWRLKPDTWTPKPLLEIRPGESILDRQISWLLKYEFEKIILTSNRAFPESKYFKNPRIHLALERKNLGTAGAVKWASVLVDSELFYVLNVDDLAFYDPRTLFEKAHSGAAMLLAKPQSRFGRATLDGDQITHFEYRAMLDFWANAGHYVFSKDIIAQYFPAEGPLERELMQQLVQDNHLQGLRYEGVWLSLNTVKDLFRIQKYFE